MDKKQSLLLALLAALVVGLYLLSVGLGSGGGTADPERSGGVEGLDGMLAKLPGVGRTLEASDVDADCFDGQVFRLDAGQRTCDFTIPADVDRLLLDPSQPSCRVDVASQSGIGSQSLGIDDIDDDGHLRIGLNGDGVDITLSIGFGADPCVIRLS